MNIIKNAFLVATVCGGMLSCFAAGRGEVIKEKLAAAEGWSPVGVAFLPVSMMEWPGPKADVNGFEMAIIGCHNREISGLSFGACGCWTDGNLNGLSVGGIGTWSEGAVFGVHFASVLNYAEGSVNGIEVAMVNSAYGVSGAQLGVVNCASEMNGCQLGLWNLTECGRGLQIGLINMAMDYSGVQLGLGNIIGSSPLTACVFFNAWF